MEEEKDSVYKKEADVAAEPAMTIEYGVTNTIEHGVHIPSGVPKSTREALLDIEEGEREFQRGETFTHKEVMQMIWDKIGKYAGQV
jgi:hypothetical protein